MTDHGLTPENAHVIASVNALTLPNRRMDHTIGIRGRMPGAIIFLHGVNDPGAAYETVETGLCQGLNERLGRNDLLPGEYGKVYQAVAQQAEDGVLKKEDQETLDNPDAFLYARSEAEKTHSPFIPFYWGYRADDQSIEKVPGTDRAATLHGQYQHIEGHRLDHDFAREGGLFPNATNNIPAMYGEGFRSSAMTDVATRYRLGGESTFIADAPERKYFVLAAHRLAMLVRTMRGVQSRAPGKDPSRETITIMGHSQGTLIALLAQALLHQQGERCADCLILVDSPYSVHEETPNTPEEEPEVQTSYAKIQTLIDIVNAVTEKPFQLPALADLLVGACEDEGRTGRRWAASTGRRPAKDGDGLITFTERDNRGKVYCYFCPEDTVVAMESVRGIGTFGVPDKVTETWSLNAIRHPERPIPTFSRDVPAMDVLGDPRRQLRFYQRLWTRLPRPDADGKPAYLPVGTEPGRLPVRGKEQRASAGPADDIKAKAKNALINADHSPGELFQINAEALTPPHIPEMYGGEIEPGGVDASGTDHVGLVAPDRVALDVILGNRYAKRRWVPVLTHGDPLERPDAERFKEGFNDRKHADDQTDDVRVVVTSTDAFHTRHALIREETPREARERRARDPKNRSENNYHSAILNHSENHRWVTAMDVAIGQAVTLDDPIWRDLLLRMANWRYREKYFNDLKKNKNYERLDAQTKELLEATKSYFEYGMFPDEALIPMTLPPLIASDTVRERSDKTPRLVPTVRVRGKAFESTESGSAP